MRNKIYAKNTEYIACSQNLSKNLHFHKTFVYLGVCNHSQRDVLNAVLKVFYALITLEVFIKLASYFSIKNLIFSTLFINYEDGFIRRGFFGTILFWFSKITNINPFYFQIGLTIIILLALIVWIIRSFLNQKLNFYIFISSFMLANVLAYNMFFFVEVYMILLTIIMFTFLKQIEKPIYKILFANVILILGSLVHEAFLVFNVIPVLYFLKEENQSFLNIKKMISLVPSILIFLLLGLYFNGQFTDENIIINSWKIFTPSFIQEISPLYWTFNTTDEVLMWRIPIFKNNPINMIGFFINLLMIFFSFSWYVKKCFTEKWISIKFLIVFQYLAIICISLIAIDYVRWFWWGNITLLISFIILQKYREKSTILIPKTKGIELNKLLVLFIGLPLGGSWSVTQFFYTMPIKHVYDLITRLI